MARRIALALALFLLLCTCALLPPSQRAVISLKNRMTIPAETDFDRQVTLAALLQPGDDRNRWSTSRAAIIEGHVIVVRGAGLEMANRWSFTRRDTHIEVALRPDAPPRERVILEVTPGMRGWARRRGLDWSTAGLQRDLVGRWCRFEGWLLFDVGHADEAVNTNPGRRNHWRATAWEIHPITAIEVLQPGSDYADLKGLHR